MVLAASTIVFVLIHAAPGEPFDTLGEGMTPEMLAELRRQLGLDQPLGQQYLTWLRNAATGNFGNSATLHRPVLELIFNRAPNTLLLMGLALAASIAFGIMLGAWQGAHFDSRRDRALSTVSLAVYSVPEFWLGLALLIVFAQYLNWLPPGGMMNAVDYHYMSAWARLADRAEHLVLPWTTLTLVGTAVFARFQRASMRDSMGESFVRTARAKGLKESEVHRHALRASLLPVITLGGLLFPALFGGAVIVERVFAWPGIGSLLFDAVGARDHLLVTGLVVAISAMTALGTLLADLLRMFADPRVAHA